MWPIGQPEASELIQSSLGPPVGCVCFNAAEQDILTSKIPLEKYTELTAKIEEAARNECHLLVPPGYDHNCYAVGTPEAPILGAPVGDELSQDCYGSCSYIKPAPGGKCPEDPNPWECNEGGDGVGDDAGLEEFQDLAVSVRCQDSACDVDRSFAEMLWDDPERLLADDARLVFDEESNRFALTAVQPGSVAYALGLRTGDVLESINGLEIDGLEAGLDVYINNQHADVLDVCISRDGRWLHMHYTFVS